MDHVTFTELFSLALLKLAKDSGAHENCWLNEKTRDLHTAMMNLAATYSKTLKPLSTLHFVEGGAFPYSYELGRTMDLLQQSGLIRRENPSYDRFRPTWGVDAEGYLEKRLDDIFEEDKEAEEAFRGFTKELELLLK
jgi:hypothetical protein